jgi:hypothetical protein
MWDLSFLQPMQSRLQQRSRTSRIGPLLNNLRLNRSESVEIDFVWTRSGRAVDIPLPAVSGFTCVELTESLEVTICRRSSVAQHVDSLRRLLTAHVYAHTERASTHVDVRSEKATVVVWRPSFVVWRPSFVAPLCLTTLTCGSLVSARRLMKKFSRTSSLLLDTYSIHFSLQKEVTITPSETALVTYSFLITPQPSTTVQ